VQLPETAPFSEEQRALLNQVLPGMSPSQLQWLTGFVAGVQSALQDPSMAPSSALAARSATAPSPALPAAPSSNGSPPAGSPDAGPVTIIFGSESGNAESLARETERALAQQGLQPAVKDMADLAPSELATESDLLVITSTWGDGDPPENAVELHSAIMGGNAPRLDGVRFSVCALGDTSYEQFCQTGREFDQRLAELGGVRIHDRVECDLDFEAPFRKWLDGVLQNLKPAPERAAQASAPPTRAPAVEPASAAPARPPSYGKSNPFPAPLVEKILLNGRGSAKETWHLELSLTDSGLSYAPGDSLAVLPVNAIDTVDALLEAGRFEGDTVEVEGVGELPIREVLRDRYDITTLSRNFLTKYNELAHSEALTRLLEDPEAVRSYLHGRQIIDALEDYPIENLPAGSFVSILRKIPPRLYSIASSQRAHPGQVHLTVAAVRYESFGKHRKGVASTFLADQVTPGDPVSVYVTPNKNFKLPDDDSTPIIMVGPGTGIAPFRAFLQERHATGANGKNWLFFGDQHFTTDFLYQVEWQQYLKEGVLDRLDVAFSRDQKRKVYVQHRMEEAGAELWDWLHDGAFFYVCGDASRMAPDVHEALLCIAEKHGRLTRDEATAFLDELRKEKRYQRDVY